MENKMIYETSKKEGVINRYALNYYYFQKKVERLVKEIKDSTIKHETFWA